MERIFRKGKTRTLSKKIVLDQFESKESDQKFCEESLIRIKENKEIQKYLLEI